MFVTLYKKCILNNDYNEVVDCTPRSRIENNLLKFYSHFTEYLDTLTSYTFSVEDTYITNEGNINLSLSLPNNQELQEYNYMRISYYATNQHTYRTTRYCFIDNIDIRNDIAVVSYSTDVWHTFSQYMTIRRSYLSRSRILELLNTNSEELSLSPYNVPVEYDGNNAIEIENIFTNNGKFSLFVKCQIYETNNYGRDGKRESFLGLYYDKNGNYEFTPIELTNIMQKTIIECGTNHWKSDLTGITINGAYLELDSYYVLPHSFNIAKQFNDKYSASLNKHYIDNYTNTTTNFSFKGFETNASDVYTEDFEIENDFKNIKVGTLFNNIECINNGTDFEGNITAMFSMFDLKLYMNFQNQLLDITDDFLVELPFTSVSGEENMSLRISRAVKSVGGILSIVGGVNALQQGGKLFGPASSTREVTTSNRYSRIADKYGRRKLTSSKTFGKTMYNEGNIASKISSGFSDLITANAPLYSSTKGTFGETNGYFNCILGGLFLFKIDSDNDEYVEKMIDETGYQTYYLGDYDFIKLSDSVDWLNDEEYNSVKCDFIDLYGDFSQDIANVLKEILLDGVKIWYTKNV